MAEGDVTVTLGPVREAVKAGLAKSAELRRKGTE
jgi:hypothetical protein